MPRAMVVFDEVPVEADLILRPGMNLVTGERHYREVFGAPTSLEEDLLNVASAIFACDLAFQRGQCEEITRGIDLIIPVVNRPAFDGVLRDLQLALYTLSHDAWRIRFTQRLGTPEASRDWATDAPGKVLLFSGGLDSLAAAVQLGEEGEVVQLSSHITANQAVSGAQESLFEYLNNHFAGQFARMPVRVGGRSQPQRGYPFPSDSDREETQRTRSFLFLVLGALAARRRGFRDVLMIAENGQMAIHLPLTAGRISAFSTHTAHPAFVDAMAILLSRLLDHEIRIVNPFLYMTKGEVVAQTVSTHRGAVERAVSCWKASRVAGARNHCGFCIPCLVRRIGIETNGLRLPEYERDILAEDVSRLRDTDDGKRNLVELGEFVTIFQNAQSIAEIEDAFPEIVNSHFDQQLAVEMYRRFSVEARHVFDQYPLVRDFLR